jgi:acetyl esterase/lipase
MKAPISFPALIAAALLSVSAARADTAPGKAAGDPPEILKDIAYKTVDGKKLKLDLYFPAHPTYPLPLILAVHGGGWTADSKADSAGHATMFAGHGYAVAAIDYRLKQDAVFPAQIQDVTSAVRWLRAHAAEYHLDPDRFGAAGHSAGGHLVSLLGTSPDEPKFNEGDNAKYSARVSVVVDLAGPDDLPAYFHSKKGLTDDTPIGLLGGSLNQKRDLALLGSPIDHVTSHTPPFIIISGLKDDKVGIEIPRRMYATLQKAGVKSEIILLPGITHALPLDTPYRNGTAWDAIFAFIDPILKPHSPHDSN